MCNKKAKTIKEIKQLGESIIQKGVKKIFITLGSKGLVCLDDKNIYTLKNPKDIEVNDVTGAGDIFTSTLAFCEKNDFSLKKTAQVCQCASIYKIAQIGTVPEDFSDETLLKEYLKHYGG